MFDGFALEGSTWARPCCACATADPGRLVLLAARPSAHAHDLASRGAAPGRAPHRRVPRPARLRASRPSRRRRPITSRTRSARWRATACALMRVARPRAVRRRRARSRRLRRHAARARRARTRSRHSRCSTSCRSARRWRAAGPTSRSAGTTGSSSAQPAPRPERAIWADPERWYGGDAEQMGSENWADRRRRRSTTPRRCTRCARTTARASGSTARPTTPTARPGARIACPVLALWAERRRPAGALRRRARGAGGRGRPTSTGTASTAATTWPRRSPDALAAELRAFLAYAS